MQPQREWFEKDYYQVLGVAANATEKEITRAYRKLAKQFHPDANQGNAAAEERFKEISAAYDVLDDAEKRKEYDEVRRMVAAGIGPGYGAPGGYAGFEGFEGANVNFEDIGGFGDLFGGLFGRGRRGRGHTAPRKGNDLETELHLDFLDSVHGITTTVRFTADAVCSVCGGSGAKPGTSPERCPQCGGSGSVAVNQGPFSFSEVCPACSGRGSVVKDPCAQCHGRGVEVRPREVKVRIPAGVADGQRIRVKGRGAAGAQGGPPGDLYVIVHVRGHGIFGRKGKDLTVRVPVTFAEAALGAKVRVPTLDEPVTVKVAPGTPSGKTVRVRGRGIKGGKGDPGDLLVTFDVVVPSALDDKERAAIETMAAALSANPREHLGV
ncbi:MAG: molecular chaperone DnaJ [Acidimicrobiia bacterium]